MVLLPVVLPAHLHSIRVQITLQFLEPEVVMSIEERLRQPLRLGHSDSSFMMFLSSCVCACATCVLMTFHLDVCGPVDSDTFFPLSSLQ